MPLGSGYNQARTAANIKAVRIMPSNYVNAAGYLSSMPVNKYYADPSYLVADLNTASNNDSATFNNLYVAGDVSFSYNSTTKKISFTGADPTYIYEPVPYGSPNLVGLGTGILVPYYYYGTSGNLATTPQPQIPQYDLNLRMGYAVAVDWTTGGQPYTQIGGVAITFDSYPLLIYTQCFYVYCSICAGSGYGSNGTRNLMAVIPASAAPLAVNNYTALTVTWLKKVSEEIYNIRTEIRDDNNQPINFPDNAIINFEVALRYDDE